MKRFILLFQLCIVAMGSLAQPGQLSISRIDQMPDLPLPLLIRDWDAVTRDYDSFIFDLDKTGTYLPLSRLGTPGQYNYADNTPLFLDSYVGAVNHLNQAEAINLMPAIVGASLVGIDKSNQNGMNWVATIKDFYNLKNGQLVYLNNYITQSGRDWWYDLMPNVYFYQLKSLYPNASPEMNAQFKSVADRWLRSVKQLGGSTSPWTLPHMNYRAFNLSTAQPLATGVPEPESAGSIAWILYNAYLETGNRKYIEGARLAMDFLTGLNSNPSYELQLAYGTIAAARMNAVEEASYPLQKLLDWCFDRGPLRGWGAIVGNWNGLQVSGLIGEVNYNFNDYAFVMNGFQQAAALAPLAKYDKRYAKALAKWLLNVTNASRLFYHNALPQANQDSYSWAAANDPSASIPYEAMKQVGEGKPPFATGDAIRGGWAATNLSLYSGSSVGYLAGVVEATNVPEILQIDLNSTDFYGDNSLVSWMYFNPTGESKQLNIALPPGNFGIYEAITETDLAAAASGAYQLTVPSGEVRLIRLYPSGVVPESRDGRLYSGTDILDYHYQYDYSARLQIKGLSAPNPVVTNASFSAWVEPGNTNPGDQLTYEWFINEGVVQGQNTRQFTFTAPANPTDIILKSRITLNGQIAEDTLHIRVLEDLTLAEQEPLIWYPFDFDTRNQASDRFHASVTGAIKTADAKGLPTGAYRFTSGENIISTPNAPELNFTDALSLSCWIKCEQFGDERYIISHGSWQQRYKLSVLSNGKLRWTVKTDARVTDLDAALPLELNRYYHVTALYTGYSMELYVDGKLSAATAASGKLLPSTHPLTIGRQDELETNYSFLGSIDEVKLWNNEIPVSQIIKLKDQWWFPVGVDEQLEQWLHIYPNPSKGIIYIEFLEASRPLQLSLYTIEGKKVLDYITKSSESIIQLKIPTPSIGVYLLKVRMKDGKAITRKIVSK